MVKIDQNNDIVCLVFDDQNLSSSFFSFLSDFIKEDKIQKRKNIVLLSYLSYLQYQKDIQEFMDCYHQEMKVSGNLLKLESPSLFENQPSIEKNEIQKELNEKGFQRNLTSFQVRNLEKILPLQAAALFSVPGSGKTSEALAYYIFHRKKGDRLLVICPKNAFASWQEQLHLCYNQSESDFLRLDSDYFMDTTPHLLPEKMIISYQQSVLWKDALFQEMNKGNFFLFVDESHRIKNPDAKATKCLLGLSCYAKRRLILSGTPMPQSKEDLVSQFSFLFPTKRATSSNILSAFQPYFTRTNESELGIPPIKEIVVDVPLASEEKNFYQLCSSEIARQMDAALSVYDKSTLATINRCVLLLLEFLSMPCSTLPYFRSSLNPSMQKKIQNMKGSKYQKAIELTKSLLKEHGKKIIIWSSFVKTIQSLKNDLKEYGADCIYGDTETGSIFDDETREGKIEAFRKDPHKRVLIMNPLACSESISLQMCCQTMIYVDRTFNAANYIQSLDRIHRIGIKASPKVYILSAKDTLDTYVNARLKLKIDKMYQALNDSSLKESMFSYNDQAGNANLDSEELLSVVKYLHNDEKR